MTSFTCALLMTVAMAAEPLAIDVVRGPEELVIQFELTEELPESLASVISSGATVEINYALRVYGRRRLFPDRRIWKGAAQSIVSFDAVTGRYRCQLIVSGTTTTSREVDSAGAALQWLAAPPPVAVPLPRARRDAHLRIRVRAVFSSGTTWLVFPTTEGTDWVEVKLDPPQEEE
jgi:hypothetical protein